ncbi:MAG: hypothetical protein ACI4EV_08255 [Lachnospiraceae bacterium]
MKSGRKAMLRKISAVILAVATVFGSISIPGAAVKTSAETGTVDGYTVDTPVAGTTYTFDFITENKVSPNTGTYGLFSFDAGDQNAASYRGDKYGVEFKVGNKLTFSVAGDCYLVVTGDNNSAGTLVATASNGTFAVDSKSAKTAGYCDIDGCLAMGTNAVVFDYTGSAGTITIEVTEDKAYINSACIIPKAALDTSKIDVWDFGAEALDTSKYNNNLTVDVINGFYSEDVEPGTEGVTLGDFAANDAAGNAAVKFNAAGKTSHRLRTTNTELSRYDTKSKTDANGTVYSGYIYDNAGAGSGVSLEIYLYPGDAATLLLGSNSNAASYKITDPDGDEFYFDYLKNAGLEPCKVYATSVEAGWYTITCTNEKLVCGRIYRQHNPEVTVSGTVTGAEITGAYGIEFTNVQTGMVTVADVVDGAYEATLFGNFDYNVALSGANGFVVSSEASVSVAQENKTFDVEVSQVELITITGTVEGIDDDAINSLELSFISDNVYVPEFAVDSTGSFSIQVEAGVEYALEASGVNDFTLLTTRISYNLSTNSVVIQFEKKPVYTVTVSVEGTVPDDAKVTFTNINEAGYSYTFALNEEITLRDGQYKVTLDNTMTGINQYYTKDAKVDGAATSVTIPVKGMMTKWTFGTLLADGFAGVTSDSYTYFYGLKAVNAKNNQNKYLLMGGAGSSVTIPDVAAGDVVTVKYCYSAGFEANGETVDEKSGSTSQIDVKQFVAQTDGDFVISGIAGTNSSQTYFTEISVSHSESAEYVETVYVGADKEYTTINAALAAVRKMTRTESQVVTIMIDPGNYEEMLVIDTPNVVLKNASATPSIGLTNKGVDIEENAVRITWYYGHGYTYYSMGSDCKANADLLEVNKANGYPSFINPGAGSTAGSYWNATVVISADNVSAQNIIFENSFNQYVSAAAANDIIVSQSGAKNGSVLRDDIKTVGDVTVQQKEYVERAAALAICNGIQNIFFDNCKFVGRQDTLYGGLGATAAFNKGAVYGGTDYIFGGMSAVFKETALVFNTNDQSSGSNNDLGYITAAQNDSTHRGFLFLDCHVTSTTPGVDTASTYTSKPGYFGRPWAANTGEAVFINTTVDAADEHWGTGLSLIKPEGWGSGLSGESPYSVEYNTIETADVDNSGNRVAWATVLNEAKTYDGEDATVATFLGEWNPFNAQEPVEEKNGLVKEEDGNYYYYVDNAVATDFTGLVDNAGAKWYVENGVLATGYTGFFTDTNGTWYVRAGKVNTEGTSLAYDGSKWLGIINGKYDDSYTGLVDNAGAKWYVVDGEVAATSNGLVNTGSEVAYVVNGKVASSYNGLVQLDDTWYYLVDGICDMTYTGFVENAGKTWYVVDGCLIALTFEGTVEVDGDTYYVSYGKLDTRSGIVRANGEFLYMTNGKLNKDFTGIVENNGAEWYIVNGKLSMVDTTYQADNVGYVIVNGKVTQKIGDGGSED